MKQARIAFASLIASVVLTVGSVAVLDTHGKNAAPQTASDNSSQNARTPSRTAPLTAPLTAQDQPNNKTDRLIAAHIRRAIVEDTALSIYAHNVKVIVVAGRVTLEGPVNNSGEREELLADVTNVVSLQSIVNRITVT